VEGVSSVFNSGDGVKKEHDGMKQMTLAQRQLEEDKVGVGLSSCTMVPRCVSIGSSVGRAWRCGQR
jgi:hypothetical protein